MNQLCNPAALCSSQLTLPGKNYTAVWISCDHNVCLQCHLSPLGSPKPPLTSLLRDSVTGSPAASRRKQEPAHPWAFLPPFPPITVQGAVCPPPSEPSAFRLGSHLPPTLQELWAIE